MQSDISTDINTQLTQVLETAGFGFWELNTTTQQFKLSPKSVALLGGPLAADAHMQDLLKIVEQDDHELLSDALKNALSSPSNGKIEVDFRLQQKEKDQAVWVSLIGAASGKILAGILRDKSATKALEQQAYLLDLLVNKSNDFIGTADADGKVTFLNTAAQRIMGATETNSGIGKPVVEFFMPEFQDLIANEVLPEVARNGKWLGEVNFRHFETGEPIPVLYQIFTINDPDTGKVIGYATASHDLTVYKKSEQQYKFVTDAMPQLVWTTDPQGYHDFFNQQWVDYTGYTVEDSLGSDMWNNLLHPDDQARAREIWGRSLRTGEPYEIEYRFKKASNGSWRWFLGRALPMRDKNGNIEKWFGTCTDIQEYKELEAALRLREEEFTALADNIPQFAWMARPDGYLFWYNQRWLDYTGSTLEQMLGDGWKNVHHPAHVSRVTDKYMQSIAAGQEWEDVFPLRSKTGEYRWFLSRAVPIRNADGEVVRWFGSNTDITEMRQLQDQLQNSYNDLEAKVTFRTLDLEKQLAEAQKRIAELEAR